MITTKTGDDGKSRWMGKTIDKDDVLLEAVGTIDELMAILNFKFLIFNQFINDLMKINGELSCNVKFDELEKRINEIEKEMEKFKNKMPKIKGFLTFGGKESILINLARTVCRRAERRVVTLYKRDKINEDILVYLNRLSDYLFVLSIIKN